MIDRKLNPIEIKLLNNLGADIVVTFWEPGPSTQGLSRFEGIAGTLDHNETELGVFNNDNGRELKASQIWNIVSIDGKEAK